MQCGLCLPPLALPLEIPLLVWLPRHCAWLPPAVQLPNQLPPLQLVLPREFPPAVSNLSTCHTGCCWGHCCILMSMSGESNFALTTLQQVILHLLICRSLHAISSSMISFLISQFGLSIQPQYHSITLSIDVSECFYLSICGIWQ